MQERDGRDLGLTLVEIVTFGQLQDDLADGRFAVARVPDEFSQLVQLEGLAKRFEGIPNVHYGEDRHLACEDFGVSEWTLTGTSVSGKNLVVRGVDLLEFAHGRITRKDSFWKIVE